MAAFLSETRHRNQPRRSSLMKRACRVPLWRSHRRSASLPSLGTLALLRQGFFSAALAAFTVYGWYRGLPVAQQA